MSETLSGLAQSHRGKFSDKWSSYLAAYDRILAEHKHRTIRLLEIGVQNGGSLELWASYFRDATRLIGCDINPACAELKFDDARIALVIGDANTDDVQAAILAHCDEFDVIIDDGSHTSPDITKSFARYFGALANDGVFIIEDLHCSYWQEFAGGLHLPTSSMAFLKQLTDVINHEHWGVATTRAAFLKDFAERYGVAFDESLLMQIHSIQFMNSACVIRKAVPAATRLGARYIAGVDGLVFDGVAGLTGSISTPPDQSMNIWSAPAKQNPDPVAAQLPASAQPVIELFLDLGHGFSATDCVSHAVELHADPAEFSFDLSGHPDLVALRLDPLADSVVLEIEQVRLITDHGEVDLLASVATNGRIANGHVYYFDSIDPQIYFTEVGAAELNGTRELRCRFRYLHIGRDAVQIALHELAVHQAHKDATYRAAIASLQESVQVFQAHQPAFEKALACFQVTLDDVRRDHGIALARESAARDLSQAEHVAAVEQLRVSEVATRERLTHEHDLREQALIAANLQVLEGQRQEHAEAVIAFKMIVSQQAADHVLSPRALQQAQDVAVAQAEERASIRLREATDEIARISAARLAERSTLSERINQMEQTLATVQGWRGYRLLARFYRPPSSF